MNQKMKNDRKKWIRNSIHHFVHQSSFGGITLLISALTAIFIANSPYAQGYHDLWKMELGSTWNHQTFLNQSLLEWVNNALMTVFFFVVGLELKREIVAGALSSFKKAVLPVSAAVGGMVFPALIYTFFNYNSPTAAGWGIPMATDIAFALGVLHLLGNKVPNSIKIFLTALAVADDLGAVLVIALFYTNAISYNYLLIGGLVLLLMLLANRWGIKNIYFYLIVGVCGVWYPFLLSGVDATVGAVLSAFTIPALSKMKESALIKKVDVLLEKFRKIDSNDEIATLTEEQLPVLVEIQEKIYATIPPLQILEYKLHKIVNFVILPLFAFANAGVTFNADLLSDCFTNVSLGIFVGLLIGKFVGVVSVSALLVKLKVAKFPDSMTMKHLIGIGILASIGFTMSLFVTNLAFVDMQFILQAKIGIFSASILGGILGYLYLNRVIK
jgi:Na+:H+ antiporter, NhaA family